MAGVLFLVALLRSEMNVYLIGKIQGSAAFQRKVDRVKHEMEYYAVPNDLQLKIKAFYDYVWIHQKCFSKIALVMEVRRTYSVQDQTICEINILKQQAFDSILRENTDFARRMNELVVARQLETSMTKLKGKGFNFRVSKVDLDRAVNTIELNMKECLERRMKQNKSSCW